MAEDIRFTLRLTPRTPPVIHGENGVSQKAAGAGKASYYVSFPRLDVSGTLNGAEVAGSAWMDHEWFTHQLEANQQGWDWFSVQLESGAELMLFQLRHADGDKRRILVGNLHRSRRARHAPEARGLPAPAARLLDQFANRRALSHTVAHHGPLAAHSRSNARRP